MTAQTPSPDASPRYTFGLTERQGTAVCVALLAGASILATFPLACAIPFAAFAVVAALMLPFRTAALAIAMVWLLNQAIGFGLLGYPQNANAAAWGLVMGAAALLATAAAAVVVNGVRSHVVLAAILGLLASYAVWELALLLASRWLGGEEAMAADVVTRLGVMNLLWLAGLLGVLEIVRMAIGFRGSAPARA